MNEIKGIYTTKRDGGLRYTYEANWGPTDDPTWLAWDAKVRKDGDLVGTPNGQFMKVPDVAETVASLVCDAIEHRAGVQ